MTQQLKCPCGKFHRPEGRQGATSFISERLNGQVNLYAQQPPVLTARDHPLRHAGMRVPIPWDQTRATMARIRADMQRGQAYADNHDWGVAPNVVFHALNEAPPSIAAEYERLRAGAQAHRADVAMARARQRG